MSRRSVITTAALAAALALAVVEPSFAASDIGENIGKEVTNWAKWLFFGCAGIISIPVLFQRDMGQGVVIVLLCMILGGFVFAPEQVQDGIKALWQTAAGTGADAKGK